MPCRESCSGSSGTRVSRSVQISSDPVRSQNPANSRKANQRFKTSAILPAVNRVLSVCVTESRVKPPASAILTGSVGRAPGEHMSATVAGTAGHRDAQYGGEDVRGNPYITVNSTEVVQQTQCFLITQKMENIVYFY